MLDIEEKNIQRKHKLVEEILNTISEYTKKTKIPIWYNLEDAYTLEEEVPAKKLKKIKESILDQLLNISNWTFENLKPRYKLELKRDDSGKIISYDLVEDLPECYSCENNLPPKKINDLIRFLPEEDEIILPTREEMKNEYHENELRKLQLTVGLQEDMEEF